MIETIIKNEAYTFEGDLQQFKRHIRNLKITETIREGECLGIKIFEAIGRFKYNGLNHEIKISKSWDKSNRLFITYLGGK